MKNTSLIIQRLLDQNDILPVRWALKNFSREEIATSLKTQENYTPINANFWAKFFKIPRSQIPSLSPERIKNFVRPRTYWPGQE